MPQSSEELLREAYHTFCDPTTPKEGLELRREIFALSLGSRYRTTCPESAMTDRILGLLQHVLLESLSNLRDFWHAQEVDDYPNYPTGGSLLNVKFKLEDERAKILEVLRKEWHAVLNLDDKRRRSPNCCKTDASYEISEFERMAIPLLAVCSRLNFEKTWGSPVIGVFEQTLGRSALCEFKSMRRREKDRIDQLKETAFRPSDGPGPYALKKWLFENWTDSETPLCNQTLPEIGEAARDKFQNQHDGENHLGTSAGSSTEEAIRMILRRNKLAASRTRIQNTGKKASVT